MWKNSSKTHNYDKNDNYDKLFQHQVSKEVPAIKVDEDADANLGDEVAKDSSSDDSDSQESEAGWV